MEQFNGHKSGLIRRVEALRYRGLRDISQEVGPFEVLVGPNASGKSTFLDVIALVRDFIRDGLDAALLIGGKENGGRARDLGELIFNQEASYFEVALDMTVPQQLVRESDLNGGPYRYDRARYELAVGSTPAGELDVLREVLWILDSRYDRGGPLFRKSGANTPQPPSEQSSPPTSFMPGIISRNGANYIVPVPPIGWESVTIIGSSGPGNATYQAETERSGLVTRIGPRRSALSALPEDPERFPIAIWVRNLLRDGVRTLALNSAAMRRPISSAAPRQLRPDGGNLPLVVLGLKSEEHSRLYTDWVAHVQTILPEVRDIDVKKLPEDGRQYLAVSYQGKSGPVPSWLLSDGTLRLFALTLLPYLPDEPAIYLIEEPEDGLHPKAIEGVFQSLSSVYRGQVFVATHSPMFMGLAEPSQLLCFSRTPAGTVDVVRGDRHPALVDWHGQMDLATLYAAGVLG